jgi:hypothetical protein
MNLLAYWRLDDTPGNDEPYAVYFEDGTAASLDEYRKHIDDTHEASFDYPGRIVHCIFPGIIGGVRWCYNARDWKVSGSQIVPFYLDLHDPDASDSRIIAELYTFPTVYRCEIIRPSVTASCSSSTPARSESSEDFVSHHEITRERNWRI